MFGKGSVGSAGDMAEVVGEVMMEEVQALHCLVVAGFGSVVVAVEAVASAVNRGASAVFAQRGHEVLGFEGRRTWRKVGVGLLEVVDNGL